MVLKDFGFHSAFSLVLEETTVKVMRKSLGSQIYLKICIQKLTIDELT